MYRLKLSLAPYALTALLALGALLGAGPAGAGRAVQGAPVGSAPSCGRWNIIHGLNPGYGNVLFGVAADSASDIWAVGAYSNSSSGPFQTLVEHWDGAHLSVVPSPSPGTGNNQLLGVAPISANDIWAVETYNNDGFASMALIEHWDGTSWSVVPAPAPGSQSVLDGVAAVSANDIWAVGSAASGSNWQPLLEHWDGSSWSLFPTPIKQGGGGYVPAALAAISTSGRWGGGQLLSNGMGPAGTSSRTPERQAHCWASQPFPAPVNLLLLAAALPLGTVGGH